MTEAITFDPQQKLFVLRTHRSFYAMRILPDGQLVHVKYAPADPAVQPLRLSLLDEYPGSDWASWENQTRLWEFPAFGDISYHDAALKAAFPAASGLLAAQDAAIYPIRDLRPRYRRHEIRTDAIPGHSPAHGRSVRKQATARQTLIMEMQDIGFDFIVRLFYRLTPEWDIIERWAELENRTTMPVTMESLAFATIHLPLGEYDLTRTAGAWAREFIPVTQSLQQGLTVLKQQGLNTGHSINPAFLVQPRGQATPESGPTYFGALAYSGNWSIRFESLPTDPIRIHGGYETDDFALHLAPGERHTTPAFVFGVADDGFDGASHRLHNFARDYVLPVSVHGASRPVLYNSWEAVYFDMTVESQVRLARLAAAIGVELFCVDDGWFKGRRSDHAGLGDWVVDRTIFPDGLNPLIEEVKKLGMRFGLWVEPEMVNPNSDLYRVHPDWVLHFPTRPRTELRQQLILDFGRPEVVRHVHTMLDALLEQYDITFFKWDMNRHATEPGSVAGQEIWFRHVAGVYSIMDQLRQKYPRLEIQSCSGGGGRVDLGILARVEQVWTSDNTDALDRVYIQDGFSLFYPPGVMESWVTHEHNHQTGRVLPLEVRFDTAMRGVLGIGTNLDRLSAEELDTYRRNIAFYRKIRPIIEQGRLHRLAWVQDHGASAWQMVLPDGSQSVYSLVVVHSLLGHQVPCHPLRGLVPEATYRITDASERELLRLSGAQLMTLGLPGNHQHIYVKAGIRSRTVLLSRID